MIYLTLPELLHVPHASWAVTSNPRPRPAGVRARLSQATVFGVGAYPRLDAKAAASLHSLARRHALVDRNKPLALAALIAFCGINGHRLTLTNDAAYGPVIEIATNQPDSVDGVAFFDSLGGSQLLMEFRQTAMALGVPSASESTNVVLPFSLHRRPVCLEPPRRSRYRFR